MMVYPRRRVIGVNDDSGSRVPESVTRSQEACLLREMKTIRELKINVQLLAEIAGRENPDLDGIARLASKIHRDAKEMIGTRVRSKPKILVLDRVSGRGFTLDREYKILTNLIPGAAAPDKYEHVLEGYLPEVLLPDWVDTAAKDTYICYILF